MKKYIFRRKKRIKKVGNFRFFQSWIRIRYILKRIRRSGSVSKWNGSATLLCILSNLLMYLRWGGGVNLKIGIILWRLFITAVNGKFNCASQGCIFCIFAFFSCTYSERIWGIKFFWVKYLNLGNIYFSASLNFLLLRGNKNDLWRNRPWKRWTLKSCMYWPKHKLFKNKY